MEREYYVLRYRLDNRDSYLIWFSTNNGDGIIVDENNLVPSFSDTEELRNYAKLKQIELNEGAPLLINLDIIKNWLNDKNNVIEDYNFFLNACNLFDDVSISVNGNFDKERDFTNNIYERIFWGCNIPVVTPEGKSFTPINQLRELSLSLMKAKRVSDEKAKNTQKTDAKNARVD